MNIFILLRSDFMFDFSGGVGHGRGGKDKGGGDRRSCFCAMGVCESDNCLVASFDNYE